MKLNQTNSLSNSSATPSSAATAAAAAAAAGAGATAGVVVPKQEAERLDFVGPSHAVKSLFHLPYATDKDVSVAVHNIGGTLLIDEDHQESSTNSPSAKKKRPRPTGFRTNAPKQSNELIGKDTIAIVTSMLGQKSVYDGGVHPQQHQHDVQHQSTNQTTTATMTTSLVEQPDGQNRGVISSLPLPPPEHYSPISLPSKPREYLQWNFHDLQLLVGSDALVYHPDKTNTSSSVAVKVEEAEELRQLLQKHKRRVQQKKFVADYQLARLQQQGKPSYASAITQSNNITNNGSQSNSNGSSEPSSFSAPDLDKVKLQTCIVPSTSSRQSVVAPLGSILPSNSENDSAPVCTVMDTYLDNIIANVPQLALCLREKGFIQSVRLLETKDIPSALMEPETLDTSLHTIAKVETISSGEPLFSPEIMEMNASTLLRFLKANCTRDNSTYLLRREAGQSNIELYDISSISAQRQRKWIWWLATMSYRFAVRLSHLTEVSPAKRRDFRARQRSLLQNALNLLEDLADRDGGAHETLCGAVCEHLADTFLQEEVTVDNDAADAVTKPKTISSLHYPNISSDALNKAQDHLAEGIRQLWSLLERTKRDASRRAQRRRSAKVVVEDDNSSSSDEEDSTDEATSLEIQSIALQLFGLHHKLINVTLRLAEHHLNNYWSSNAMQALRSAARKIVDAVSLLRLRSGPDHSLQRSLKYQFTWLWEHCGHFARSFAADDHWRDRGHACGDDVISVLQDAHIAFSEDSVISSESGWWSMFVEETPICQATKGEVSLFQVSGLYSGRTAQEENSNAAKKVLDLQKVIQRDRRQVLVAATVAYSRAIWTLEKITGTEDHEGEPEEHNIVGSAVLSLLRQRLGDACNEIGKIMLTELRQHMGNGNQRSFSGAGGVILSSAEFWFKEGLETFRKCDDLPNLALLCCNLCQCSKLRANSFFSSSEPNHVEKCLQSAADHLVAAHDALGQRDTDRVTWDMVSQELAATFLVLGVRRRQSLLGGGTTPLMHKTFRLSPGEERSIVEPMEKALQIYGDSGNAHQAAATHYQLALFFARVWTCQRDETKTRDKLSAAFTHYNAAYAYFQRAPPGNESTFVLLCLDLANLYSAVSGQECLSKALARCLGTVNSFGSEAVEAAQQRRAPQNDWFQKMATLVQTVEERVLKLLVSLVKIEKLQETTSSRFKDLYRVALTAKMKLRNNNENGTDIDRVREHHECLLTIKEEYERTCQTQ